MSRIYAFLLFFNMFVLQAVGFSSHLPRLLKNNVRLQRPNKCFALNMQMESRRAIFMRIKPLIALPITMATLGVGAETMQEPDTWTKHNGAFTEDWLKDFEKLPSGLLYKDIDVGKGDMPNDADAVSIHMVGYIYETGEKWTNTYKGIPTFQSTVRAGVRENQKYMKGLNEGVKTMRRGGKRILVIPAYLAYNYTTILAENNPNAPIIPGGSSLVCYVEVLDFKPLKK